MLNRLIQGIIASTLVGAAVGAVMLMRRKNSSQGRVMEFSNVANAPRTRGTIPMVRNNAKRWTSAVRSGTKALTRKLSNV